MAPMQKSVVTRFAPSPTGFLHIGGARTALFNWLYAKHTGGKFLLRIEDTDRERSTQAAVKAILDGLKWLELDWDGEPLFQFERAARHREVAQQLLAAGKAYHCYASAAELEEMREAAKAAGRSRMYDGRWRDRDPKDAPDGVKPVIRLKAPLAGETVIEDQVQGRVVWKNSDLDDMVIRATRIAYSEGFAQPGQRIIIMAGVPLGTPGATNMLRIAYVGKDGAAGN